ncbi:Hypothetical protein SMAX5B_015351 [Scophthalmus maximus]|uniref:Uncharacterized protein n=1 Tax=Scophthalmus maximus TaxID=52904 RepID=A0A2U9CA70_SCOMX|nr:Hypothetical protein SMAX5B_015351 [Scophthalmus maximus]
MRPVPKHRWLMQVYAQDVLQRLDEVKAAITSQYGRILKWIRPKRWLESLPDIAMAPLPGQPTSEMSMDSHCIFMWDEVLKMANLAELETERKQPSQADVLRFISRSELAFDGAAGRDTLGVPFINSARMNEI